MLKTGTHSPSLSPLLSPLDGNDAVKSAALSYPGPYFSSPWPLCRFGFDSRFSFIKDIPLGWRLAAVLPSLPCLRIFPFAFGFNDVLLNSLPVFVVECLRVNSLFV